MFNSKLYLVGGTGSRQIIEITGCTTSQRGIMVQSESQKEISIENAICTSSTEWKNSKFHESSERVFHKVSLVSL